MFADCNLNGNCHKSSNKDENKCTLCSETSDKDEGIMRCDECHRHSHVRCLKRRGLAPENLTHHVWYCGDCLPTHTLGTCWVPLGDVSMDEGVLALLAGSTDLPRYFRLVCYGISLSVVF